MKRGSLAQNLKALSRKPDPAAERPPSSREGLKKILVPVEPELHKRLKLLAVQQDRTMESIMRAALTEYLDANA